MLLVVLAQHLDMLFYANARISLYSRSMVALSFIYLNVNRSASFRLAVSSFQVIDKAGNLWWS